MARLLLPAAVLGLYITGLVASLLGPAVCHYLGLLAVLLNVAVLGFCFEQHKRAHPFFRDGGISGPYPAVMRLRPFVRAAMLICLVSVVASYVVQESASQGQGVTDGTRPIFEERARYKLNAHGVDTEVSRVRYLLVGSSFEVGWYACGMFFALLSLHLTLFGDWPPGFRRAGEKAKKPPIGSDLL